MTQLLFRNFQLLEPEVGELAGRLRAAGRGRHHPGGLRQADQGAGRRRGRLRRAHADARPDRQPRPRDPQRGEHPLPRSRAADLDDGARRAADARHDRSRLHHACATPAAPTGASRPRSSRAIFPGRACSSPARAIGPTGGHSDPRRRTDFGAALPLLQRHGVRHARSRRRRRRGAQGGARADAPGRRPDQDHDVGRRRLALRSARQPAVQPRRRSPPRSRRRRPSAAMSAPTPTRPRRSPAPRMAACAPSSTAT